MVDDDTEKVIEDLRNQIQSLKYDNEKLEEEKARLIFHINDTLAREKWELRKEIETLKSYIDCIFDGEEYICQEIDVEDVKFHCSYTGEYIHPNCTFRSCFEDCVLVKTLPKVKESGRF